MSYVSVIMSVKPFKMYINVTMYVFNIYNACKYFTYTDCDYKQWSAY